MTFLEWLQSLFGKPTPTSTPTPTPDPGYWAERLVVLHNQFRATNGKPPLTVDSHLTISAQTHALDMFTHKKLSHQGSDGSNPFQRMTKSGYSWIAAAENVAFGQTTADAVMQDWEEDLPHAADILGPYKNIGVGRAGTYWCVDFGAPR